MSLYDRNDDIKPSLLSLAKILTLLNRADSPIFAVFDGFDECGESNRKQISELLVRLQDAGYHILIATRPHVTNLDDSFKKAQRFEILASDLDLREYIKMRLFKDGNTLTALESKCLDLVSGFGGV